MTAKAAPLAKMRRADWVCPRGHVLAPQAATMEFVTLEAQKHRATHPEEA